jgi:hypothetical protein
MRSASQILRNKNSGYANVENTNSAGVKDIVRNAGKKRSSNQKDEIGTNRKSKTRQLSGFSML